MSNDIEVAVKHAVDKQHLQAGDTVDKDTAMNMMNDVWKELQKEQRAYSDKPVSAVTMKVAANELEKSLGKYGVKDIEFYDSNNDGKADKNDDVYVKTGYVFGNQTYNLGDRPAAASKAPEGTPIWKNQLPEYNKDPQEVQIKGYNNR